ncbi:cell division protein FtsQ/DivIB [Candidatus Aminicenantes bacterium AC-708-I09]|nr:cell division protein FtsQ/DivIB [Candidatus Aminicenantes bacterium AC-708-I09]
MRLRSFFILFLLISMLFYLARQTYLYLINSDYLNVKEIQIFLDNSSIKKEFEKKLSELKGKNIILISLDELKRKLMEDSRIENVSIRKILPSKLSVEIELRKPFAVLAEKGNYYLIDEKGVAFQKLSKNDKLLPVIFFNKETKKEELFEILSFLKKIKNRSQIHSIEIFSSNKIYLRLNNEKFYLIFDTKNLYQNFISYVKLIPRIKRSFGELEYIDLRFKDRIYVKPFREENNGKKR